MKRLDVIVALLFTAMLVLVLFIAESEAYDQVQSAKLTPTRELVITFIVDGVVVVERYPVVRFIENEPFTCAHPFDPRYKIQFDYGYVIPKEPFKKPEEKFGAFCVPNQNDFSRIKCDD
jgi:hypothetical protein